MNAAAGAPEPITIAVLAIGGQGGGVIADWLVGLAEAQGWQAQSTSVPGVAQRTGATLYYVEMLPATARKPVLALMPAPGAVDLVVAAEWMEAGRAIQRGLVTPDRTTLIASTHRAYSVAEKSGPARGLADPAAVERAADAAARRLVKADFAAAADRAGSIISASLLGAVAASGVLPFPRPAFEDTIRAGGRGIAASLAAFANGFAAATDGDPEAPPVPAEPDLAGGTAEQRAAFEELRRRIDDAFAPPVRPMIRAGLVRVVDFQDTGYGAEYLDRLGRIAALPGATDDTVRELARHLAVAMAYQDVIRVADLKTRAGREARVRRDTGSGGEAILATTEYFHPRIEELEGLLPVRWNRPRVRRLLGLLAGGRRLRSGTIAGFAMLYGLAGLRRWRRGSVRHAIEMQSIALWLARIERACAGDPTLAVEIVRARRLIKGYSDTHARGLTKYDKVLAGIERLQGRSDAADWARRLREAALKDAGGEALDGALKTIESFVHDAA